MIKSIGGKVWYMKYKYKCIFGFGCCAHADQLYVFAEDTWM